MTSRRLISLSAALILLTAPTLFAQRGDRKGAVMEEVWKKMDVPPAPVRTAEEEAKTFKTAPGFHVELVACEPMVEEPVAMAWDERGRLWVVEMRGYMPNVDGSGEYESNTGRVSVLEDTDGDGKMDKVTRFLEGLKLPRAIGIVKGGVLIGEPPNLWFCRVSEDLKCIEKTKVCDYGQVEPVEKSDNGLCRALDNWIYNATSDVRLKWADGKFIVDRFGKRGQWGICQDDYGRLYFNANEMPFMVDLLPGEYYRRNPTLPSAKAMAFRTSNFEVFPIRPNPGVNRGYEKNYLRADGSLRKFTAASSILIYRGDQWPSEYRGKAIVPGPCGNIVKLMDVHESGVEIRPSQHWPDSELWASTDERFRPVTAYNAPDGSVYVCDIYHGILQHKIYMTTFLRKQIIERGLDKPGVGLGRIWRIVADTAGSKKPSAKPALDKASTAELVATLNHPNGWWRDTAQRLLVERGDSSAVPLLRTMATKGETEVGRIHALWTLQGLNSIDKPTTLAALHDDYPMVRAAAVRTAEPLLKTPDGPAIIAALNAAATKEDQRVRTQMVLTLGEVNTDPTARAAISRVLNYYGDDVHTRQAAISSLAGQEMSMLQAMLAAPEWAETGPGRADVLAELASSAFRSTAVNSAALTLDLIAAQPAGSEWRQLAMLNGVLDATKKRKLTRLAAKPAALETLAKSKDKLVAKRAPMVLAAVTWPGDERHPKRKELTAEEKQHFEAGRVVYTMLCFACHQTHGGGQVGIAPPLVDSEWVQGPPNRVISILLGGLQGPIKVNDESWNLMMPPLRDNPLLDDQKIADVLTYIRNEWGNEGSAITKEQVAKMREKTKDRTELWTSKELEKIK